MAYGITLTRIGPNSPPDALNQPAVMRVDATSPVGTDFDGGVFLVEQVANPPGSPTPFRNRLVSVCKLGDMLYPLTTPTPNVNPPWFRSNSTGDFPAPDPQQAWTDIVRRVTMLIIELKSADDMIATESIVLTSG